MKKDRFKTEIRYIIKNTLDETYLCSLSSDKVWFNNIKFVLYLNSSKECLKIIEGLDYEGLYEIRRVYRRYKLEGKRYE